MSPSAPTRGVARDASLTRGHTTWRYHDVSCSFHRVGRAGDHGNGADAYYGQVSPRRGDRSIDCGVTSLEFQCRIARTDASVLLLDRHGKFGARRAVIGLVAGEV